MRNQQWLFLGYLSVLATFQAQAMAQEQSQPQDVALSQAIFENVAAIAKVQSATLSILNSQFTSRHVMERDQLEQCKAIEELRTSFYQEDTLVATLEKSIGPLQPTLRPLKEQISATRAEYERLNDFCGRSSPHYKNRSILDGRLRSITIAVRRTIDALSDITSIWPGLDLNPAQSKALLDAVQSSGFVVAALTRWNTDWDHRENLIILGEAHIKNDRIAEIGRRATEGYDHLGLEGASWLSPELAIKLEAAQNGLKTFMGCPDAPGKNPESSSTIAQGGLAYLNSDRKSVTFLEKDIVLTPTDQEELKKFEEQLDSALSSLEQMRELEKTFFGKILVGIARSGLKNQTESDSPQTAISGQNYIIDTRNEVMSLAASQMSQARNNSTSLVIVGANHVAGMVQILKSKYGYSPVILPRISAWSATQVSQQSVLTQICGETR